MFSRRLITKSSLIRLGIHLLRKQEDERHLDGSDPIFTIRTKQMDEGERQGLLQAIEHYLHEHLPEADWDVTGFDALFSHINASIVRTQIQSLGLAFLVILALLTGCGDPDDVVVSCGDLEACEGIACNNCGWPNGSCSIPDGDLVSTTLPDSSETPFFILVDIEILSETQPPNESVCQNAEIVIENRDGDLLSRNLTPDQPVNLCSRSFESGVLTVSLLCDAFPTRGRYRVSIADGNGAGVWP
jgi:hypothetical protein